MTLVRQQAFTPVNQGVRNDKPDVRRDERTREGGSEASRADVGAYYPPLRDPTTDPDGRGRGQNRGGKSSESVADQLAYQIGNLSPSGINRAVKNLEGVRRANQIPTDSPLATIGPHARAATFNRGTLLRADFSHRPWAAGRDGKNLSTAGKPFAFQSPGYNAGRAFSPQASDIPQEWASQMGGEMHNARANADKPYMRTLLAAGRYSLIRV